MFADGLTGRAASRAERRWRRPTGGQQVAPPTAARKTRRGCSGEAARTAFLLPTLEEKGGKGCVRQAAARAD
jgi:hypothetical protein